MNINTIKNLIEKYHLRDLTGVVSSLIMAFVSYIPLLRESDLRQVAVVTFFFVMFALRLGLFVWNHKVAGTAKEDREQAKMMLVSSIVLLLMQATFLTAIVYQLLFKKGTPLMASQVILAIIYGVYALARIVLSIRRIIVRRKLNFYEETLSYIGWISALYALALFTNYILIAQKAYNYVWPRYIMVAVIGFTIFQLAIVMMIKAGLALRRQKKIIIGKK